MVRIATLRRALTAVACVLTAACHYSPQSLYGGSGTLILSNLTALNRATDQNAIGSPALVADANAAVVAITFNATVLPQGDPMVTVGGVAAVCQSTAAGVAVTAPSTCKPTQAAAGGGYTFTYTYAASGKESAGSAEVVAAATDSAGNTVQQSTHVLFDSTAPTLALASLNPNVGELGQPVTLGISATEPILPGTLAVQVGSGYAVCTAKDAGNQYFTCTFTITDADPSPLTIDVSGQDAAGNVGDANWPGALPWNNGTPQCMPFNVAPQYAKSGTTITITCVVDMAVTAPPTVTLGGAATTLSSADDPNYVYTYTVTGNETQNANTPVVATLTDPKGVVGTSTTTVDLDFTPPTFAATATPNPAARGAVVVVTLAPSEALGRPAIVTLLVTEGSNRVARPATYVGSNLYNYAIATNDAEGLVVVTASGADLAGNQATNPNVANVIFDFTPPALGTVHVSPGHAAQGSTLTITFTATDAVTANPNVTVTVDGNPATFVDTGYTYSYVVTGSEAAQSTITVVAVDAAGNTSTAGTTVTLVVPPHLIASSPAANAAAVNPNGVISLTFDQPVGLPSSSRIALSSAGGSVAGSLSYVASSQTAIFIPSAPLSTNTVYTVAISGVQGTGTPTTTMLPVQFSFTTDSPATPTIQGALRNFDPAAVPTGAQDSAGAQGTVNNGTYTITVVPSPNDRVFVWNDADGDGQWDAGQEARAFFYACGGAGYALDTRRGSLLNRDITAKRVQGTVQAPARWVNPVVGELSVTRNAVTPDDHGAFALWLASGPYPAGLTLFDDANGNAVYDAGELAIPFGGAIDLCSASTAQANYNLTARTLRGTAPNNTGTALRVQVIDLLQNFAVAGGASLVNNAFTVTTGDSAYGIYVFTDANGNGKWDPTETQICASGAVAAGSADVGNIVVNPAAITGSCSAPGSWSNSKIAAMDGNGFIYSTVPCQSGSYSLPAGTTANTVFIYSDANADSVWQSSEARVNYGSVVNTTSGSVSGINFGTASLSGAVYTASGFSSGVPSSWTAPLIAVVQSAAQFVGSLTGDIFGPITAMQLANTHVFVFNDLNGDNAMQANEPHIEAPAALSASSSSNVVVRTCKVQGSAVAPTAVYPAISALKAFAGNPGLPAGGASALNCNTVSLAGGSPPAGSINVAYSILTSLNANTVIGLFLDSNLNSIMDTGELAVTGTLIDTTNCTSSGMTANSFSTYAVSGALSPPPTWSRTLVYSSQNPNSMAIVNNGAYTLGATAGANSLYAFNDANGNAQWDSNEARIAYAQNPLSVSGNVSGINFTIYSIAGQLLNWPADWQYTVAIELHSGSTAVPTRNPNDYAVFVGQDSSAAMAMFNDINSNLQLDGGEPVIAYAGSPPSTASGSVAGIDISPLVIKGQVPSNLSWQTLRVATDAGYYGATASNGSYQLAVSPGNYNVFVYNDLDNSGTWTNSATLGEPRIMFEQNPVSVSTTNPAASASITAAEVDGMLSVPPVWSSPAVTSLTPNSHSAQNCLANISGSNYSLLTSSANDTQVIAFDDANQNNAWDPTESRIDHVGTVDTSTRNATGIDIFYQAIYGTLSALAPQTVWSNPAIATLPYAHDANQVLVAQPPQSQGVLANANYMLFATPGSTGLVWYNDSNFNGYYDVSEAYPSVQYCPSGSHAALLFAATPNAPYLLNLDQNNMCQ